MTLEAIDTTLSDEADAAEEAAPGDPQDAVIWDEVVARTGEESRFSVSYQAFLTIACLLAAIGAITDSPVTVVGAMVLGPFGLAGHRVWLVLLGYLGVTVAVAVGLGLLRAGADARAATRRRSRA